jgi:hypothetical protein
MKINDEIRLAYQECRNNYALAHPHKIMADALRDTLARALIAENKLAYNRTYEEFGREFEQWQTVADEKLMEEVDDG